MDGRSQTPRPADLSAVEAARRLAGGEITSEALVSDCLARIAEREETVRAWTYLDADYALEQARRADEAHRAGLDRGPLAGVPVGIKDIFDTADMPTEYGSPLGAGRQPEADSSVVAQLRQAGAVVLGKTVTTEFAVYAPNDTTNPHDPGRTPGGSSSGSAAAVAAGMVPLATGSQTNGSMIRPASYCGVVGFKPSFGRISRRGVLALSRLLDQIGVFARSVEDAALMADCLTAYDPGDPDMRPRARPQLLATASEDPPVTPLLAFVKTPVWDRAESDTVEGFAELVEALGDACDEVSLPEPFEAAVDDHRTLMVADLAINLASFYARGAERISDTLCAMIEDGQKVLAVDYARARDRREVLYAGLEQIFERYDAIITPAASSQAPKGLEATGDPIFCTLWTYLGVPAVSLPILQGDDGLPVGVQMVGRRGGDGRLLRTARWLLETLAQEA